MAGALAVLIFVSVTPADVQSRYLIALLPLTLIVSVTGIHTLANKFAAAAKAPVAGMLAVALALAANALIIFQGPWIRSSRMDLVAAEILASGTDNPLVLVSSHTYEEGALIAAFAEADVDRKFYVIRGLKVLGSGDFTGYDYKPRFDDTAAMDAWITANRIGWFVLSTSKWAADFSHNLQAKALADSKATQWRLVSRHAQEGDGGGETRLYRIETAAPSARELGTVLREIAPTKLMFKP
jgi:hypothetical protein